MLNFIIRITCLLDRIILPLKIEWKHNYHREKVQLYPSIEFCEKLKESGTIIEHDKIYPGYFDWVLYDGDNIVVRCGAREFDETQTEFLDKIDTTFFETVERYIDTHKYFCLTLWLIEKTNLIKPNPESIK